MSLVKHGAKKYIKNYIVKQNFLFFIKNIINFPHATF